MIIEARADQGSRQEERELSIIRQSAQALAELVVRIGSHFRRAEVRNRVGRYLQGLLASVERKNGWQMAEELEEANAHGVQRLLEEADWDEEAVRDEVRTYVIEQLGESGGILVVDETGFVKKGKKSAGVAAAVQRNRRATGKQPDRSLSLVRQQIRGRLHRSSALPARRVDGGSGALS